RPGPTASPVHSFRRPHRKNRARPYTARTPVLDKHAGPTPFPYIPYIPTRYCIHVGETHDEYPHIHTHISISIRDIVIYVRDVRERDLTCGFTVRAVCGRVRGEPPESRRELRKHHVRAMYGLVWIDPIPAVAGVPSHMGWVNEHPSPEAPDAHPTRPLPAPAGRESHPARADR